jgi:nitrile hydratase subunit beta
VFHADWERRLFGIVRLTIDERYNWDEFRSAIERLTPVEYLSATYYERWLSALERYLVEKGDILEADLRQESGGRVPRPGIPPPDPAESISAVSVGTEARFQAGDRVYVRNLNPSGHTRLPRYVRGRTGTIDRLLGVFTYPDTNALQLGNVRQQVYAVRFTAREIWGSRASSRDSICVDLWDEYLDDV